MDGLEDNNETLDEVTEDKSDREAPRKLRFVWMSWKKKFVKCQNVSLKNNICGKFLGTDLRRRGAP